MTYIDIGLNLFCRQFPDPDRIMQNAENAGVTCILTGSDMSENRRVNQYVRTHPAYGTCGIHPHNADRMRDGDMAEIQRMLQGNVRLVAVGECGLDYNRMFSTKEHQWNCLQAHIQLAEALGKPMFLHEREAAQDLLRAFQGHEDLVKRSVVHCFTGDRKTLEQYLQAGFMIGITGWICDDRRGQALRDAVKMLPLDRVMLETDAPYLTPKNVPGLDRTNVPENIRFVADTLAIYMGVGRETLQKAALDNTLRFFRLGDTYEA